MIIATMNDSFDTAQSVLEDLQEGVLDVSVSKEGFGAVGSILRSRGECVSASVAASMKYDTDRSWIWVSWQ